MPRIYQTDFKPSRSEDLVHELTRADRERLAGETEKWNRLSGMIGSIPRATPEGASAPSHLSLAYCRNYVLGLAVSFICWRRALCRSLWIGYAGLPLWLTDLTRIAYLSRPPEIWSETARLVTTPSR